MKKHTNEQIKDAICKWSAYLLENKIATENEVHSILSEGLFKRAKAAVKGALSKAGHGISSAIKATGKAIHDTFAANEGINKFMKAIGEFYKKGVEFKNIKLFVYFDEYHKTYPIADFVFSKNKKTLVALFSEENDTAKTFADLYGIMEKNGMTGGKKQLSDYTDALYVGKIEPADKTKGESTALSEAVQNKDISRIQNVVGALGWSKKHALNAKSVQKILRLFGLKDDDASDVKEKIKEYFATKGSSGDSEPISPDKKDTSSSGKPKDKDDGKTDDKDISSKFGNDEYLKTADGVVGVMDCPFKDIMTQEKNGKSMVAIVFGAKKKDTDAKKDMETSIGA